MLFGKDLIPDELLHIAGTKLNNFSRQFTRLQFDLSFNLLVCDFAVCLPVKNFILFK